MHSPLLALKDLELSSSHQNCALAAFNGGLSGVFRHESSFLDSMLKVPFLFLNRNVQWEVTKGGPRGRRKGAVHFAAVYNAHVASNHPYSALIASNNIVAHAEEDVWAHPVDDCGAGWHSFELGLSFPR